MSPNRDRLHFLLLNVALSLDDLFSLIFATVSRRSRCRGSGLSGMGELLTFATPGFVAFGLFSLPADGSPTNRAATG